MLNFGGPIFAIAGQLGGRFLVFFCCELCVEKKIVCRAKSLHRSSHRSVLFLALLNATSQRSVPFLALLGADVWWRCCCCWFVLPRCDAEWVRFFVAPLNGIRNFLSAKRRFEGGSNVVDVDDASKIGGKKSVKKSGGGDFVGKKSEKKIIKSGGEIFDFDKFDFPVIIVQRCIFFLFCALHFAAVCVCLCVSTSLDKPPSLYTFALASYARIY